MNPPKIVNADGFVLFWAAFPNKTGKLAAIREWNKLNVDADFLRQILMAVEEYKRTKPDWKEWCMPRTWLCQGRFLDEVPQPATRSGPAVGTCPHEPRCRSFTECRDLILSEARRDMEGQQ